MIIRTSAVKQFLSCPRSWWFRYVQELLLAPVYGMIFGNVLHAVLERWLNEEEPFPRVRSAG